MSKDFEGYPFITVFNMACFISGHQRKISVGRFRVFVRLFGVPEFGEQNEGDGEEGQ